MTNKENFLNNLKQAGAESLKKWIIQEFSEQLEEDDIEPGLDNGYTCPEYHIYPIEDYFINLKDKKLFFPNFKN